MAANSPGKDCPTIWTFLSEHLLIVVPAAVGFLIVNYALCLALFKCCIPELRIHSFGAVYFWFLAGLCLLPYSCLPRPDDEEAWRVQRAKKQAERDMGQERKRAIQQEKAQAEQLRRDWARQQVLQTQRDWQVLHSKESDEDRQLKTPGAGRTPLGRPAFREIEPSPRTESPHPDISAFTRRAADTPLARSRPPMPARKRTANLPWGDRLGMSARDLHAEEDIAESEVQVEEETVVGRTELQSPPRPSPGRNGNRFSGISAMFGRGPDARAARVERGNAKRAAAHAKRQRKREAEERAKAHEQRFVLRVPTDESDFGSSVREEAQREIEALQLQKEAELEEREIMLQEKMEKLKYARMKEKQRQQATMEVLEAAQRERELAEQAEQEAMARQAELEERAHALAKRQRREERQRFEEEQRERMEAEAYEREMARRQQQQQHRRQRSIEEAQPSYPMQSGYSRGPTPQQAQHAQMMQMRCVSSFAFGLSDSRDRQQQAMQAQAAQAAQMRMQYPRKLVLDLLFDLT
jgi:hypothetical protein